MTTQLPFRARAVPDARSSLLSKSLILLRHAKSSWNHPELSDFDRPLNKRGVRAAAVLRVFVEQEALKPDMVLCSAAKRTVETWEAIQPGFTERVPVAFTKDIYEASADELYRALRNVDGSVECLMVIGHNPGMERIAASLCPAGVGGDHVRMEEKFPTGAMAFIELDVKSWSDLVPGCGALTRFVTPKELI